MRPHKPAAAHPTAISGASHLATPALGTHTLHLSLVRPRARWILHPVHKQFAVVGPNLNFQRFDHARLSAFDGITANQQAGQAQQQPYADDYPAPFFSLFYLMHCFYHAPDSCIFVLSPAIGSSLFRTRLDTSS